MKRYRICHITTAHARDDVRIFLKELTSLSDQYDCHLIVGDDLNHERRNNVQIWSVGKGHGRLKRAFQVVRKAYRKALDLKCDVYHFHDPEFIFAGLLLTWKGKKVVYDIHEDVPRDVLSKEYLGGFKKLVSILFETVEDFCAKRFSYLITATPYIRERFKIINPRTVDINNYPLANEYLSEVNCEFENRTDIIYMGAITRIRGLYELVKALDLVDVKLDLAGNFESMEFEAQLRSEKGWQKVNYHGMIGRSEVKKLMQRSIAGIVTFYPEPNHINAQPNKIFEYMSAGLPVICSNFVSWKEIIENNQCGVLVDPMNPREIAEAVESLRKSPSLARSMALNGIAAVNEKYNWNVEKVKLLEVYKTMLN